MRKLTWWHVFWGLVVIVGTWWKLYGPGREDGKHKRLSVYRGRDISTRARISLPGQGHVHKGRDISTRARGG